MAKQDDRARKAPSGGAQPREQQQAPSQGPKDRGDRGNGELEREVRFPGNDQERGDRMGAGQSGEPKGRANEQGAARRKDAGPAGEQPQGGQRAERDRAVDVERELEEVGTER
jgi:hypothetical protein